MGFNSGFKGLTDEILGRQERVPQEGLAAVSNILVQIVDILLACNVCGGIAGPIITHFN